MTKSIEDIIVTLRDQCCTCGDEAASALEDLQAENDRLDSGWHVANRAALDNAQQRDAAFARLAAIESQAPVAWMREWQGDVSDLGAMILTSDIDDTKDGEQWQSLFASAGASSTQTSRARKLNDHDLYEIYGRIGQEDGIPYEFGRAIIAAINAKQK